MKRPILLWMTSRSRSSMVSKIFANHGVWWGDTLFQTNGYYTYENKNIVDLQRNYKPLWGHPFMRPVDNPEAIKKFQTDLEKIVPSDRTWMIKAGVEFFPAYEAFRPYNIFIYRPIMDVVESFCKKRPNADRKEAQRAVEWRYEYMSDLIRKHGGNWVNTDHIVEGNFAQLEDAFHYVGIEFHEEKAIKAIVR